MPQSPFGTPKQVDAWMGLVILTSNLGNALAIAGSLKQVVWNFSPILYFFRELETKGCFVSKAWFKKINWIIPANTIFLN